METTVKKYNDALYAIDQEMVRCFVVLGTEKALVIDTGAIPFDIKSLIKQITNLPYILCLSHKDRDHTANMNAFPVAYIHEKEIPLLERTDEEPALEPVKEGFCFHLGERDIEVVSIPGHTPGSIGFLDRKNKIFFSGDTVSYGPVYMFGDARNIRDYRNSLLRLKEMAAAGVFKEIYPCHNTCPVKSEVIDELLGCVDGILNGTLEANEVKLPFPMEAYPKYYKYKNSGILFKNE